MPSLKTLRNQLGLSQSAFAGLLQCSAGQLSMAESGVRSLPPASVALAAALQKALATAGAARQETNTLQEKTVKWLAKHTHQCQVRTEALEIAALKLVDKLEAARRVLSLAEAFSALLLMEDGSEVQLQMTILQRKASKKIGACEEKLLRMQLSIAGLQGEIAKAEELTKY